MSEQKDWPESNWRHDPAVKEALKERRPEKVSIVHCGCGWTSYYNEGSHFTCRNPACRWTWHADNEGDEDEISVELDPVTVADAIEEELELTENPPPERGVEEHG